MDNGLEDSKMTDFRADEVKTHSTTFEGVNKYSVIRDRSKIEIAAVLFNTKTGKIENAARCSVRNHGTTGIRPNLVQEQKKRRHLRHAGTQGERQADTGHLYRERQENGNQIILFDLRYDG